MRFRLRMSLVAVAVLLTLPLVTLPAAPASPGIDTTFIAIAPLEQTQGSVNPFGWTSVAGLTLGPTPALASFAMSFYEPNFPISFFTLTDNGSSLSAYVLATGNPNPVTGAIVETGSVSLATGNYAGLIDHAVTVDFSLSPADSINDEVAAFGIPVDPGVMVGTLTVS
ncbi:MAG TPA: hypothetical protein VNG12_10900 [Acidimicrobiales bacterium]|nr:hypothetical protein [Acidimicrobiales bacterium]